MQTTIEAEKGALEKRIESVTRHMQPWVASDLKKMPEAQADTILQYIMAMQREENYRDSTKRNHIVFLMNLSKFHAHKAYSTMTRDDLQLFLDSGRKTEEDDPLHKWIGTYNARVGLLGKFFRWLCFPDKEAYERSKMKPPVFVGIRKLPRQEESAYTFNDMWTEEDDLLFLTYCPSEEMKCYHSVARDTSARPHELLKLAIEDIAFKVSPSTGRQYAEIVSNGKTGQRPLPLFDSIGFLKRWLNVHPMRGNPKAPLFPTMHGKNRGRPMTEINLYMTYVVAYQKGYSAKKRKSPGYFQRILKDPSVPPEDKARLEELLKKPWNPYIRRHTGLTDKARLGLSGPLYEQHGGWSPGSKMPRRYTHFFGGEANMKILELKGVAPKERTMQEILKPKICTNCNEPNPLDAPFCLNEKCKMPLNITAWQAMMDENKKKELDMQNYIRQAVEDEMQKRYAKN